MLCGMPSATQATGGPAPTPPRAGRAASPMPCRGRVGEARAAEFGIRRRGRPIGGPQGPAGAAGAASSTALAVYSQVGRTPGLFESRIARIARRQKVAIRRNSDDPAGLRPANRGILRAHYNPVPAERRASMSPHGVGRGAGRRARSAIRPGPRRDSGKIPTLLQLRLSVYQPLPPRRAVRPGLRREAPDVRRGR